MTKPTGTTNSTPEEEANPNDVVDDTQSDDDLGINFFENFADDDGEAAAPSEESDEVVGSGDGDPAASSGGEDQTAAPPAPSDPAQAAPQVQAEKGEAPAQQQTPQVPSAQEQTPEQKAAAQQQTPAQQTQDQQQAPTQPVGNEVPGDMLSQVRAAVDQNRQVYTDLLADKVYGLSEDDAKTLFEAPEKVLPQLAAKVHLEVVQNVLGTLAQVLPAQIAAVQQAQVTNKSLLDDFWNSHPTLDRQADHAAVMQLAQLYRAQNPNASFEEFKQVVGAQAMVALKKLPIAAPPTVQPSAPARPQPHVPAGRGGVPLAPTGQPTREDFWAGFAEHLDE